MSDCDAFYRLRDERSEEYLHQPIGHLRAVHVAIDASAADSAAGQLALLALVNQIARTSRRITIAIPAPGARVHTRTPFAGTTLGETLLATVRAIDPCGEFELGSRPGQPCVAIGLGAEVGAGFDWYLGADLAIAHLRREPVTFSDKPGTLRGAALASCLGAAAVLRGQLGLPMAPRTLSAWNYREDAAAEPGPFSLDALDVGGVLMVGAGAVGAALAFWLHAFGVRGDEWAVVGRDTVKIHNTNRGLAFTAAHAGWPDGEEVDKAGVVTSLIAGSTPHVRWYHECPDLRERKCDVILALANDYDARLLLSHKHAPVALRATTGENWLSQVHRHLLGHDGCVQCRTGTIVAPRLGCSTGEVETPDGTKTDAALPFLSSASGLMLATALQRLATGELTEGAPNCWSWYFDSDYRMAGRPSVRSCLDGCGLVPGPNVRRGLTSGSRWPGLVG